MTDEEKKAIEYLGKHCKFFEFYYDDELHKQEIDKILNLIEKQQSKLEKKDKIIDAMSDTIETSQYANIDNTDLSEICCYLKCKKECDDVKKECIKEYFEKKEG